MSGSLRVIKKLVSLLVGGAVLWCGLALPAARPAGAESAAGTPGSGQVSISGLPAPQPLVSRPPADQIQTLAPGVCYYPISGRTWQDEPLKGHVLEVDPGQALLEVRVAVGGDALGRKETLSRLAARHGAVAAVNGGYFDPSSGHPIGSLVQDGRLLATSGILRTSVGITGDNRVRFGYFAPRVTVRPGDGEPLVAAGVNTSPVAGGITLYTPAWGERAGSAGDGIDVVVRPETEKSSRYIVSEIGYGGSPIPRDGYVLTFRGEAAAQAAVLAVGTPVDVQFDWGAGWEGLKHLVTAGPLLVDEGQPLLQAIMEGFRGSVLEPAPRTAIGVDGQGRLLLVEVDGRLKEWSAGVTLEELAYLMADLGAVRAAALDGGGSSAMWVKGRLVSRPSGGRERELANAILVLHQVPVYLNGERLFFDVPPLMDNGRTLVPMRRIFEVLGAEVSWNEETRTVTATRGERTVSLALGQKEAVVNGKTLPLDVPARAVEGRTMVPLRFVGEALGAAVTWQGNPPAVIIEQ
ncbi:Copper amine oxidase N-terminal domain-containing protein [Desulfofundulus australicus DSM 11792]|uniref:Copper amine oxidase N-terminal domain-containing protein n=1 Tax=Desulfofundulus australicus DSM 11792 TaxID=1121425 RepID=A0A1M4WQ17_9FIRM|nr:phosphodiester glycosidase family protein [Desulfofundulus australicus]SHE83304.1 Copper amine oxidase N-terminal domain-containing protein [Desulfofundulus australicus DSM 11792]